MGQILNLKQTLLPAIIDKIPNLLGALLLFIVGWVVINVSVSFMKGSLTKRGADATLIPFVGSLVNIILKAALLISLAGMVGIKTTSFVAVLGAAGLAVGLALQGSLSNFAGGVLILIFKPFRVGDFVESGSFSGTVHEIQIFYTTLLTTDNKTITLPNGSLANGAVTNYSSQATRRVNFLFGIAYDNDFQKAKTIIMDMLNSDERVLSDPAPFVRVSELGNSSVDITARAWVKKEDYWGLFHDITEKVKETFDKEGIEFPFPQQEVSFKTALKVSKD